jgi:magnesium chelatase family protein
MLACTTTPAVAGLERRLVKVQVDIAHQGLPNLCLIWLPTRSVKVGRERVRDSIKNKGRVFPLRRIIVNQAPAQLPRQRPYMICR